MSARTAKRRATGSSSKGSSSKGSSSKGSTGRTRARDSASDAVGNYRVRQLESSRFGIVYDIDGPRVRLGVVWFLLAVGCLYLGLAAVTVLFAGVAALAAAQTATALRTRWRRPDRASAAALAAAVPVAAAVGTGLAGLVLMVGAVAVSVAAVVRRSGSDPVVDAGAVVRSALFVGLAAAAVVMLFRVDIGAAATLVLLISAYEFGDFLVGTGAANQIEGPASGILAVVVATGALAVAGPPPFEGASLWLFAAVAAVAAPLGQVLASALLPRAGAPARALRRLDSYLVAAPVWLVLMWAGVQGQAS